MGNFTSIFRHPEKGAYRIVESVDGTFVEHYPAWSHHNLTQIYQPNVNEVGRRTCYATGYADTFFSIPACTRWKGRYVGGYFTENVEFRVYDRFKERLK